MNYLNERSKCSCDFYWHHDFIGFHVHYFHFSDGSELSECAAPLPDHRLVVSVPSALHSQKPSLSGITNSITMQLRIIRTMKGLWGAGRPWVTRTWHDIHVFQLSLGWGGVGLYYDGTLKWDREWVGEKGKHKKNPHTTKAPLLRDDLQYFVEKWHKISTCIVSVRDTWCADFLLFSFAFLYILHLQICFRMCTGLTLFLLRPVSPWFTSLWKAQVT